MASGYLAIYERFPEFLKRRINPSEYSLREFVGQAAERHVGQTVLDAGAGESRFRHEFHRSRYVGIDLGSGDPGWSYADLDAISNLDWLPLKSGSVEAVINTQVLEHVPEPKKVLEEFARVLRKGGSLYLTVPQGWPEHQQPLDFYRFTRFSLQRLLSEAGFSRYEIRPMGGYFHYLGHRLTFVPKVLFQSRKGVARALLLPLELAALSLCCVLGPLVCYYLDRFDTKKEFTLLYRCEAVR